MREWRAVALSTLLSVYLLVSLEWLFFVTKPSFLSILDWPRKCLVLGISALPFLLVSLAIVGLFGVLSYVVSQRTQEIGVRMALGAETTQVQKMVVAQGIRISVVGLVVGLLGATALTRLLQGLLFGTAPLDPLTFIAMSVLLLGVGLLASYLPARKAAAVDPVESMRME